MTNHNVRESTFLPLVWALLSFLLLNTLLLLPSFFVGMQSSDFFPIPDTSQPTTSVSWSRGWYDVVLYVLVRRPNQDLFRICVELFLLAGILVFFAHRKQKKVARRVVLFVFLFLLTYEVYNAIVVSFFHRNGILYEDMQYAINLYYLASDLFSIEWLLRVLVSGAGIVGILWLLPRVIGCLQKNLSHSTIRRAFIIINLLFWPVVFAKWSWYGAGAENTTLRTLTPKMAANMRSSVAMKQMLNELNDQPVDSVYTTFEDFPFDQTPNIHVIMIESYGEILNEDSTLSFRYEKLISEFNQRLVTDDWLLSTAVSRAPVRGGLSWMSMNTLLGGIRLDNNTLYHRYRAKLSGYPHLPSVLESNGYATFTLQPPTRARAGLPVENLYNFSKAIYFDDLNYKGPAYSLFIIPDQYSLNYAYETYISPLNQPYFLFFETVITHAPWEAIPPLLSDWKQFNEMTKKSGDEPLSSNLLSSFQRRLESGFEDLNEKYIASLSYDFDVIKEFILEKAPQNSLFLILGDHQPPLLKSNSYLTPIHVISRDSVLMSKFIDFGFKPGTRADYAANETLYHEGLYSLLVSILSQDSLGTRYRPEGISPSFLAR